MLTFMMEISNPPLDNNLDFQVGMTKYSTKVEEETGAEFTLHGEELRQAELQKRAFRKEVVDELLELRLPVDYSSEEELSVNLFSNKCGNTHELVIELIGFLIF